MVLSFDDVWYLQVFLYFGIMYVLKMEWLSYLLYVCVEEGKVGEESW